MCNIAIFAPVDHWNDCTSSVAAIQDAMHSAAHTARLCGHGNALQQRCYAEYRTLTYQRTNHKFLCLVYLWLHIHGVATIRKLLKIIGLFCRISSLVQSSVAKETYHFKEPTNRSYPIPHMRDYIHSTQISILNCDPHAHANMNMG